MYDPTPTLRVNSTSPLERARSAHRHANARLRHAVAAGDDVEASRARVRVAVAALDVAELTVYRRSIDRTRAVRAANDTLHSARHAHKKLCLELGIEADQ